MTEADESKAVVSENVKVSENVWPTCAPVKLSPKWALKPSLPSDVNLTALELVAVAANAVCATKPAPMIIDASRIDLIFILFSVVVVTMPWLGRRERLSGARADNHYNKLIPCPDPYVSEHSGKIFK